MSARLHLARAALLLLAACAETPDQGAGAAEAAPGQPGAGPPSAEAPGQGTATQPEEAPEGPRVVPSNGDGFRLEWSTEPSPPPLNGEFSVRFRLLDAGGTPLATDLSSLGVDADMPAHGHGMNVAPKLVQADGWVEATPLLFHMPGAWELYVDLTEGPLTERAQVPFEVR